MLASASCGARHWAGQVNVGLLARGSLGIILKANSSVLGLPLPLKKGCKEGRLSDVRQGHHEIKYCFEGFMVFTNGMVIKVQSPKKLLANGHANSCYNRDKLWYRSSELVLDAYMTNNHVNNMVCMTMSNTKSGELFSLDLPFCFNLRNGIIFFHC